MLTRRALFGCGFAPLVSAIGRPNAVLVIDPADTAPANAFSNYHAASPDRDAWLVSVLTGRFPHAAQEVERQIQFAFKKSGYTTALVGPLPAGFGTPSGFDIVERTGGRLELAEPYFTLRFGGEPEGEALIAKANPSWLAMNATGAELPADVMISSVDILPTMLGLLNIEAPQGLQGRDAFASPPPESVYIEGDLGKLTEWRSVVRGLDRLIVGADFKPRGLFNLGLDPEMRENLADSGAHRRKRDEMMALFKQWMLRTGDRMNPGLRRR